jgi:hypothetical protein
MEGLNQMEALILQQGMGNVDVSLEHTLVHVEAPLASAPRRATWSKKLTSRPASAGRVSRKKGEGSTQRKKQESLVRATEDAEIPHSTVADRGLCLRYRLAGISVPLLWCLKVSGRMSHLPSMVGSRESFRIVVTNYDVHRLFLLMRNCGIRAWVGSRRPVDKIVIPGVWRPFGGHTGRAGGQPCPLCLI